MFGKIITAACVVAAVATGALAINKSLSARTVKSCCYEGSPCCFVGSPCCEDPSGNCCYPGSPCCYPGSPCCEPGCECCAK